MRARTTPQSTQATAGSGTHQLEALLLEARNDLGHQTALDAVWLDHDEGAFTGHIAARAGTL